MARPQPFAECDLAVVGAGILGLAVARELRAATRARASWSSSARSRRRAPDRPQLRASSTPASTTPRARSRRGSASRARATVRATATPAGSRRALRQGDRRARRGRARRPRRARVPRGRQRRAGLRRLAAAEIARSSRTPRASPRCTRPRPAIVDFPAVARALARRRDRGRRPRSDRLRGDRGDAPAAGGCGSHHGGGDRGAPRRLLRRRLVGPPRGRAGASPDPRIVPFRGATCGCGPSAGARALADLPGAGPALPFLGVHLTRHIDGEVLVGPTALLVGARDAYRLRTRPPRRPRATRRWPGTWRMARRWWRTGLAELRHAANRRRSSRGAARYVPELRPADVLPGRARRPRAGRRPRRRARRRLRLLATRSARCTCATPRRPPRPRRWRSRGSSRTRPGTPRSSEVQASFGWCRYDSSMAAAPSEERILELVHEHSRKRHAPRPFDPADPQVQGVGAGVRRRGSRLAGRFLARLLAHPGPRRRLRARVARRFGTRHALLVNSGSSANLWPYGAHLADARRPPAEAGR